MKSNSCAGATNTQGKNNCLFLHCKPFASVVLLVFVSALIPGKSPVRRQPDVLCIASTLQQVFLKALNEVEMVHGLWFLPLYREICLLSKVSGGGII